MPLNYASFIWNIVKIVLFSIIIYRSLNPVGLFTVPILIVAFIFFFKALLNVIHEYNMRNI